MGQVHSGMALRLRVMSSADVNHKAHQSLCTSVLIEGPGLPLQGTLILCASQTQTHMVAHRAMLCTGTWIGCNYCRPPLSTAPPHCFYCLLKVLITKFDSISYYSFYTLWFLLCYCVYCTLSQHGCSKGVFSKIVFFSLSDRTSLPKTISKQ